MRASVRTAGKGLLSMFLGVFSLPMLGYGGYLSVCWVRIHTSDIYYTDYPYATVALVWFAVGSLNFYITLRAIWRLTCWMMTSLIALVMTVLAL